MSLQVWLPLTKDLRQQGIGTYSISTLGTISWVTGKLGNKAMRAGDGTQIQNGLKIEDNFCELLNGDYSISVWVKPYGNHVHYNGSIFSSGNWNTSKKRWAFGVSQNNTKVDVLCNDYNTYIDCTVPVDEWTHLVCTCGEDRKPTLYKNGVYIGQLTNRGTNTFDSDYTWSAIGRESYANGYFSFNGAIQDFRLYNNCLSAEEVKELSKGLILHYPLNRCGWGQENLATCTTPQYTISASSTSNYNYFWINSSTLEPNTTYTFSAEVQVSDNIKQCTIYNYTSSGNSGSLTHTFPADGKRHSWTFTTTTTGLGLIGYAGNSGATAGHSAIYRNIKVEKGDKATPYIPRSNEALYTTMSLNGTTEYDTSGYCNNGTKNNITYTSDTPKYVVSSTFNGSNSYIKVNDNNWMIKGMSEMTVNLWAKATTWPTNGGRLISCTETGGFNLEAGNSGYWRFPVYVYTNSGQTSSAYKYDSNEIKIADLIPNEWDMITLVYDNTGTKTYLNGELHHTYTNTSYGINFNTNARLFLGCEANTASPYVPYFNGMESDFRIYATALSADDIQLLYQGGHMNG